MNGLDRYLGLEPDFDVCLKRIEYAIDAWASSAENTAMLEADLKAYEATQKKALMDSNKSAVLAETTLRAHDDWAEMYQAVQTANIKSERWKQKIKLEQARFEAARSVYSATKKAVG